MFDGQKFSGPSRPRLHFIRYNEDSELIRQRLQFFKEIWGRNNIPPLSLDRLYKYGRYFVRRKGGLENLPNRVDACHATGGIRLVDRTPVTVGIGHMGHARHHWEK